MSYKNAYKAPLVTKKMHLIYILLNKNKLFTACASAYIQMKGPDITRCTWAQDYLYIYIYIYLYISNVLHFTIYTWVQNQDVQVQGVMAV